jgi:hypothetical protein
VALAVLFFAASTALSIYLARKTPEEYRVTATPIVVDRYAVSWDQGVIVNNHRTVAGRIYLRSGVGKDGAIFPINVALFFIVTSRRDRPQTIRNYKVQMETDRDEFVELNNVSVSEMEVYAGLTTAHLSPVQQPETFFENAIKSEIKPYGTARGWLFYQYPKDTGRRFRSIIKLTLSDYSGDPPFTTGVLTSKAEKTSQPANLLLGEPVNLSDLPIQFMDNTEVK